VSVAEPSWQDIFRLTWFAKNARAKELPWRTRVAQRSRAVFCHLKSFCAALIAFCSQHEFRHVINTSIVDDCEIRLRNEKQGQRWGKKTVMNCIQHLHFNVDTGDDKTCIKSFQVQQPFMPLEDATGPSIWSQWVSWLVISMAGIGATFQLFGVVLEMFMNASYIATCVCRDALYANRRISRSAKDIIRNQKDDVDGPTHVFLDIECCVHQVGLIRQVICLYFNGYWTNLVRLGNLFDSCSFRSKWQEGICLVILEDCQEINMFPSTLLPSEVCGWREVHHAKLGFAAKGDLPIRRSPQIGRSPREVEQVCAILDVDNGDPDCSTFTLVHISDNMNASIRLKDMQKKLARAYLDRFGEGFSTPLLQRWKHGEVAQSFISETRPSSFCFRGPFELL
jgi:hypothetical protein